MIKWVLLTIWTMNGEFSTYSEQVLNTKEECLLVKEWSESMPALTGIIQNQKFCVNKETGEIV